MNKLALFIPCSDSGFTNKLLAKLSYKITFVAPTPVSHKNNNTEVDTNAMESGDQLSSNVREEVIALGNCSQVFAPRVRLKDLYVSRVSSGEYHQIFGNISWFPIELQPHKDCCKKNAKIIRMSNFYVL